MQGYQNTEHVEKYTLVNDDFPVLGSENVEAIPVKIPEIKTPWGNDGKSFKEVIENTDITFNYAILKKRDGETSVSYFSRLYGIFKNTTTLYEYDIYMVYNDVKSYTVAARHEIIARMLCQMEDDRHAKKVLCSTFAQFKTDILDQMYSDDEIWEEVMGYVNYDKTKRNKAILMYYGEKNNVKYSSDMNWLNPSVTTCNKTTESCISEEKILC